MLSDRGRKSCEIIVPFEVEDGYQVAVVALDYRGYNFIPEGGRVEIRSAYSFHGETPRERNLGKVLHRHFFQGPVDEEYLLSGEVNSRSIWSPCGSDIHLRVNTTVSVGTNHFGDEVLSTVDSLDAVSDHSITETTLDYHLLWRKCDSGRVGRPHRPIVRRPPHHPRPPRVRPPHVRRPHPTDRIRRVPPRRPGHFRGVPQPRSPHTRRPPIQ